MCGSDGLVNGHYRAVDRDAGGQGVRDEVNAVEEDQIGQLAARDGAALDGGQTVTITAAEDAEIVLVDSE